MGGIGSALGPAGTAAGMAVGIVAGGAVGALYGVVVKPAGTYIYNEAIEPVLEWSGDKINDIADWWSTLCW